MFVNVCISLDIDMSGWSLTVVLDRLVHMPVTHNQSGLKQNLGKEEETLW